MQGSTQSYLTSSHLGFYSIIKLGGIHEDASSVKNGNKDLVQDNFFHRTWHMGKLQGKTDTGKRSLAFLYLLWQKEDSKSHCLYACTATASVLSALSKDLLLQQLSGVPFCRVLWVLADVCNSAVSEYVTQNLWIRVIFTLEHDRVSFFWTDIFFKIHKALRISNKREKIQYIWEFIIHFFNGSEGRHPCVFQVIRSIIYPLHLFKIIQLQAIHCATAIIWFNVSFGKIAVINQQALVYLPWCQMALEILTPSFIFRPNRKILRSSSYLLIPGFSLGVLEHLFVI